MKPVASVSVDSRAVVVDSLSRTPTGGSVPPPLERSWRRLASGDRFTGWAGPIAITLLALFLRLWNLGRPHQFSFDETYYAKDAYSMLKFGYVRDFTDKADKELLAGNSGLGSAGGVFEDTPAFISHPELGKWIIAIGEKAFGMDPFGWRVMAAVVGALMVLVMCRLARRLTGSTMLGCLAGLLLSLDGLHLVLSRLALLDIFSAFFALCGVAAVVADRDWFRSRLTEPNQNLWWRPWLIAAGVSFGAAVGVKWTAVYIIAAFGLLVWLWSAGARRALGLRGAVLKSALRDGVPAFFAVVGVGLVVYVSTWAGWLNNVEKYEKEHADSQYRQFVSWDGECGNDEDMQGVTYDDTRVWPTAKEPDASGFGELPQSLRSLWYYHQDLYVFHAHFLNCAEHTYGSKPSGWLLLNRPVGVDAQLDIKPGDQGCGAAPDSDCLRQVLLLGNPVIWWGGCAALLFAIARWVGGRDWRFGVPVIGTAVTWLPWLRYDDRPIFIFYAIATLPFLVLAVTLAIGHLLGPSSAPNGRRTFGVIAAGTYVIAALLAFAWFWPIWTDVLLTHDQWTMRMWFRRWI